MTKAISTVNDDIDLSDEFTAGVVAIEIQISDRFPADFVKILKKIAYEVSVIGLSEQEACMIADYPYDKFVELKNREPLIKQLIETKDLEYKRGLLKNISEKARKTDDKLAMWLLEAKYPKEFNRKKGTGSGGDGDGEDMISMALEFVRRSGDKNSLVNEESGRAFIIKTKKTDKVISDINQILR